MYKLVAMDLDGTLLDSHKQISQRNLNEIKRVIQKGVRVVVCSGRIYKGAKLYARQIGTQELVIACNGATIRDASDDSVIFENSLNPEDCLKIIDICHDENIYFHTYVNDTMYTEKLMYGSTFYSQLNKNLEPEDRIDVQVVDDVKSVIGNSHLKASKIVVVSDDRQQLLKARKRAEEVETIEVMSSFDDNFEVMNRGVSKANALDFIMKRYGIINEEVIAIGDNENDYSMIKMAGLGIAMGNGEDSLKEIAGYITLTNDEDGVAVAIKKFL